MNTSSNILNYNNNYYSFGSVLEVGVLGSTDYRYGFGGIEKSPQINSGFYEADFRIVDTRIGRWLSPDPVKKHWESPYASFANNPVYYTDPSGLDPEEPEGNGGNGQNNPKTEEEKKECNCESSGTNENGEFEIVTKSSTSPGTESSSSKPLKYKDSNGIMLGKPSVQDYSNIASELYGHYSQEGASSFAEFMEGFSRRYYSNITIGISEAAGNDVYNEDDSEETRKNKAAGAITADLLGIWTGAEIGTGSALLLVPSVGFSSVGVAYGGGVSVKSAISLQADYQVYMSASNAVNDYSSGNDEGEHYESQPSKERMGKEKRSDSEKMPDQVAKDLNIKNSKKFKEYLHKVKREDGRGGADNYTWDELKEIGNEYKQLYEK